MDSLFVAASQGLAGNASESGDVLHGESPVVFVIPVDVTSIKVGPPPPSLLGLKQYSWMADSSKVQHKLGFQPTYVSSKSLTSFLDNPT